ncbi:MAG TPA: class I SAM-dependent methyltransferase [Bryobacteraceae bacterium]|nr:class I SAM-dependent methyltransferase [Bryobacteraceae bacterium]
MHAGAIPVSATEGYALWADTWDSTPSPIVALEQRALSPWIERLHPRRAVDVGCGTGRWTGRFSAIGIDASPAMLALAARKPGLQGRLAVADATALPIAANSADLVLCTLTLGHIRDRAAALHELSRILEPAGALVLTDFHPATAARGWRRTFRRDGQVYELENYPHTLDQLREAAPLLTLRECAEAAIGEPERALFDQSGRPELFEVSCGMPAILLTLWTKSPVAQALLPAASRLVSTLGAASK